jgi:hypothetical protein
MSNRALYAYFAGAIDADGFISIQRAVKSSRKWRPTYYTVKIGFTGTSEPTVQMELKETFGGSVYTHTPKNISHKTWYTWQASGPGARGAIEAILPHLRNKRGQAEYAIKLLKLQARQWAKIKKTQKPPYHVPPDMEAERQALWEAVTRLNQPRNRRVHFV